MLDESDLFLHIFIDHVVNAIETGTIREKETKKRNRFFRMLGHEQIGIFKVQMTKEKEKKKTAIHNHRGVFVSSLH